MTKEMKEIIRMVISAAIVAFAIAGVIHSINCESKMEEIREKTIEEAILVYSDENGYVLSFAGEEYYYSFS